MLQGLQCVDDKQEMPLSEKAKSPLCSSGRQGRTGLSKIRSFCAAGICKISNSTCSVTPRGRNNGDGFCQSHVASEPMFEGHFLETL